MVAGSSVGRFAATPGEHSSAPGGDNPEYAVECALPDFAEAVLDLVDQIPPGRVLSYGDVAELLGQGGPRQVGSVLSRYGSSVTWWRVIRASGEAPESIRGEALARWRAEGTPMVGGALAGRRVDMSRARWDAEAGRAAGVCLRGRAREKIVPK